MGATGIIEIIDSTDKNVVKFEWSKICNKMLYNYLQEHFKYLYEEELENLDTDDDKKNYEPHTIESISDHLCDILTYSGTPLTFNSVIKYIEPDNILENVEHVKEFILSNAKKWDYAVAIVFENKTYIGGWVAT